MYIKIYIDKIIKFSNPFQILFFKKCFFKMFFCFVFFVFLISLIQDFTLDVLVSTPWDSTDNLKSVN